jgi:hypothetical protein
MSRYARCLKCRRIRRKLWWTEMLQSHWFKGAMCPNIYEFEPAWRAWPRMAAEVLPGVLAAVIIVLLAGGRLY